MGEQGRATKRSLDELDAIEGWFFASDRAMFRWFLEDQQRRGVEGDLLELGCYMGKSAILMGAIAGTTSRSPS